MIITGGPDRPETVRRQGKLQDGTPVQTLQMIASPDDEPDRPHAFLVQQPPCSTLQAHYHYVRQFQLVVRGSGALGRHALVPITVHYTAAETGYGPIVAGDDGLWYFTLRQVVERGAHYLPESAPELREGLIRRQKTMGTALLKAPLVIADAHIRGVIAKDRTGLGAWEVQIPPGAAVPAPRNENGSDRYHVVTEGSLEADDGVLSTLSVTWVSREEPVQTLRAGPGGAQVMVLQFPADL